MFWTHFYLLGGNISWVSVGENMASKKQLWTKRGLKATCSSLGRIHLYLMLLPPDKQPCMLRIYHINLLENVHDATEHSSADLQSVSSAKTKQLTDDLVFRTLLDKFIWWHRFPWLIRVLSDSHFVWTAKFHNDTVFQPIQLINSNYILEILIVPRLWVKSYC